MNLVDTAKMRIQIDGDELYFDVDIHYQDLSPTGSDVLRCYCELIPKPSLEQNYQMHNQAKVYLKKKREEYAANQQSQSSPSTC